MRAFPDLQLATTIVSRLDRCPLEGSTALQVRITGLT